MTKQEIIAALKNLADVQNAIAYNVHIRPTQNAKERARNNGTSQAAKFAELQFLALANDIENSEPRA